MSDPMCASCGETSQSKFCGQCGTAMPMPSTPSAAADVTIVKPISQAGPARPVEQASEPASTVPRVSEKPSMPPPVPPPPRSTVTPSTPPPVPPPPQNPTGPGRSQSGPSPAPPGVDAAHAGATGARATPAEPPQIANPFTGLRASDGVLDVAAVVLALWSLGLTWTMRDGFLLNGSDVWWIVIAVLVAVAGTVLPYVQRAGLLGALHHGQVRLLTLAACVPGALGIVLALVLTAVNGNGYDGSSTTGLGGGVVVLAGALVLITLPRSDSALLGREEVRWRTAGPVVVGIGAVLGLATFIVEVISTDLLDAGDLVVVGVAALVLPFLLMTLLPVVGSLRGSFSALVVLAAIGGSAVVHELLAGMGGDAPAFVTALATIQSGVFSASFLVAAGGLALCHPRILAAEAGAGTVQGWVGVARMAQVLTAGYAGLLALSSVVLLVNGAGTRGKVVAVLVLCLLISSIAAISLNVLRVASATPRLVCVGGSAVILLLGAVVIGLVHGGGGGVGTPWMGTAAFLVLPVLTGIALTAPHVVRDALGPLVTIAPQDTVA